MGRGGGPARIAGNSWWSLVSGRIKLVKLPNSLLTSSTTISNRQQKIFELVFWVKLTFKYLRQIRTNKSLKTLLLHWIQLVKPGFEITLMSIKLRVGNEAKIKINWNKDKQNQYTFRNYSSTVANLIIMWVWSV